jgi:hypothetical protein
VSPEPGAVAYSTVAPVRNPDQPPIGRGDKLPVVNTDHVYEIYHLYQFFDYALNRMPNNRPSCDDFKKYFVDDNFYLQEFFAVRSARTTYRPVYTNLFRLYPMKSTLMGLWQWTSTSTS